MTVQERRFDIDWLRISLFFLLILYHVGRFYGDNPWHVKSVYAPVLSLEVPMGLMNPWRIPALFVISGIALRFALDKVDNQREYFTHRLLRLGLPILFGMAVICAPQSYFELKQDGIATGNVLTFYLGYLSLPWLSPEHWTMITPTWNHLWYVVYLLILSSILIAISVVMKSRLQRSLDHIATTMCTKLIMLLSIPFIVSLVLTALFLNSIGAIQTVWGDWHRLANSFWLILFGFTIAKHPDAWLAIKRLRWIMLGISIATGIVLTFANLELIWAGPTFDWTYHSLRGVYSWAVIMTLLGFVQVLGRGSDKLRRYLSDAVFPYYVLHQTVIIVLGVWLTQFQPGLVLESTSLIAGTAAISALLYHFVIRHLGWAAIIFGGRPKRPTKS